MEGGLSPVIPELARRQISSPRGSISRSVSPSRSVSRGRTPSAGASARSSTGPIEDGGDAGTIGETGRVCGACDVVDTHGTLFCVACGCMGPWVTLHPTNMMTSLERQSTTTGADGLICSAVSIQDKDRHWKQTEHKRVTAAHRIQANLRQVRRGRSARWTRTLSQNESDAGGGGHWPEVSFAPNARTPPAIAALTVELKLVRQDLPVSVCRVDLVGCDIFHWEVALAGPSISAYRGGTFFFSLKFPSDYPSLRPVAVRCLTPIYHCNIDSSGTVCLGLDNLCTVDNDGESHGAVGADGFGSPCSTGSPHRQPSPLQPSLPPNQRAGRQPTGFDIIQALISMLHLPSVDDALVPSIADLFLKAPREHDRIAQQWVHQYAL
eukprot:TRINITY_DN25499_c0_g1_i1.p1 TRINITY_DN25499_c0_g1~~TRINITY_DN25499_c0_g1_i1.p1  ORF type:complete len:380 (-),score=29.81 TRINITY_DN25499_c0_g1_i1:37-1176(-)